MANQHRPIVIRKIRKHRRNHDGQWKIAYADFVTAMMAFFLLMWLLSSSSKAELQGISEYFQVPLVVSADGSGGGSVIHGGGDDLTRQEGHVSKYHRETSKNPVNLKAAHAELERLDARRLEDLKSRLERLIQSNPTMREFRKQLLLDITTEGLRIQIVDDQNRPMFALARAELEPHTKAIL
ncbi:MAG TPA: flagellar motor protein MotB, partial [Nitrosospira sp.]|nr:flagellar motor protein MotB [Nitrosospira sp.]